MGFGDCGLEEFSFACKEKKRKNNGCNYSCHKKGCQCGKCPRDHCTNPKHYKGCHCGEGMHGCGDNSWGIAE